MKATLLCGLCLILGMGMLWAQDEIEDETIPFENFVPEDSLFFYCFPGVAALVERSAALPIVELVKEIVAGLEGDLGEAADFLEGFESAGINRENAATFFPGGMAFAVYPGERKEGGPAELEWGIILKAGKPTEEFTFAYESLVRRISNILHISDVKVTEDLGYTITTYRKAGQEVFSLTLFNSHIVVNRSKNELRKTIYRMKEKRLGVLADNMLYKALSRNRPEDPHGYFFLDTVAVGALIKGLLPAEVIPYLEYLRPTGLMSMQGLAGSSRLTEQGVEEEFQLHFDEIEGLLAVLSGINDLDFDFKVVPPSAYQVTCLNVDFLLLWNTLDELLKFYKDKLPPEGRIPLTNFLTLLAETEAEAGVSLKDDIVSNVEGSLVSFLLPLEETTVSGLPWIQIFTAKVFDAETTEEKLITYFNDGLKMKLSQRPKGDHKIYFRKFNQTYLAFVFVKERIYVAQSAAALATLIDRLQAPKGSVLDNPKFAALLADSKVKSISFIDFESMFAFLARRYGIKGKVSINDLLARMLRDPDTGMDLQPGGAPQIPGLPQVKFIDFDSIGKKLNIMSQVVKYDDSRIEYRTVSPVPLQAVIPGVMGYLLLWEIPKIPQERARARKQACHNKLENMATYLELYSWEHNGLYPKSLEDLYPQYVRTLDDFVPPGLEGTIKFKDQIPEKGMFVYRTITNLQKLQETDIIIYQKKGIHADGFYILLRNGDVKWLVSEQFEKTVKSLQGELVEIIE